MTDWQSIIQHYPACNGYTYLNTPSCGLIAKETALKAEQYQQELLQHGGEQRGKWYETIIDLKKALASFIHVTPSEIALIPNFSLGMNFVVPMLKPLKKVLCIEQDYPSLCLPWLMHDYQIFYQPMENDGSIDLEKIAEAIHKHKIKILAISHVFYNTGYCIDLVRLANLCHEHGTIFLVDATQSLGAQEVNVSQMKIDILIASGYKWMTAGFGNGLLYVRKDLLSQFHPSVIGNNSFDGFPAMKSRDDIQFTMRSFEVGHFDFGSFLNMYNALIQLKEIGINNIQQRIYDLVNFLYKHLGDQLLIPFSHEKRSGIILLKGDHKIQERLHQHKITSSLRGKGIRVGLHFYNQEDDVLHLASVIQ